MSFASASEGRTVRVPLTRGKEALIDAADWPLIRPYKWHAKPTRGRWYAFTWWRRLDGGLVFVGMHRLLIRPPEGVVVDHISGDGLDNRRCNLRMASPSQNNANARRRSSNTSGYKGVTWDAERHKWLAQIRWQGRNGFLGRFVDPEQAARAYDAKARELFGAFALCNFG